MKRVSFLAMLALALPVAACANSVDFALMSGTIKASGMTISITATVDAIKVGSSPAMAFNPPGTAEISMTVSDSPASSSAITGGSIKFMAGSYVFDGTIESGGNWSLIKTLTGDEAFSFGFLANGTLKTEFT